MRSTHLRPWIIVAFTTLALLAAACSDSDGTSNSDGSDNPSEESDAEESQAAEQVDFNELADTVEMPGP